MKKEMWYFKVTKCFYAIWFPTVVLNILVLLLHIPLTMKWTCQAVCMVLYVYITLATYLAWNTKMKELEQSHIHT